VGSHGIGQVTSGGVLNGVGYQEWDGPGEGNGTGRAPRGKGEEAGLRRQASEAWRPELGGGDGFGSV
jgi:hypothetical protein